MVTSGIPWPYWLCWHTFSGKHGTFPVLVHMYVLWLNACNQERMAVTCMAVTWVAAKLHKNCWYLSLMIARQYCLNLKTASFFCGIMVPLVEYLNRWVPHFEPWFGYVSNLDSLTQISSRETVRSTGFFNKPTFAEKCWCIWDRGPPSWPLKYPARAS